METAYHIPVMLKPCIEALNIQANGTYVDVTFGGGGHSKAILERLGENGRLFAFDKDFEARKNAQLLNDDRLTIIPADFRYLKKYLRLYKVSKIDGLLADLGISSHQIDAPERGFSTRFEGPLDMRMDTESNQTTASDIVNNYDLQALTVLFRNYAELSNARAVANAIIRARALKLIETTSELKSAVQGLAPRGKEFKFFAQVFQALRIEVNDELKGLEEMLLQTAEVIKPNGSLVIMSYHSLEDRLVKNWILKGNLEGDLVKDFYGNDQLIFKAVHRKPLEADEAEISLNSRARSARLRVATKL